MSTTSRPTTTTTGIRPAMPCANLASCSGRGAAAAGYRRAPGAGEREFAVLLYDSEEGKHPGHRRAPAAGGGGAGHRAPGLQRRPLPDHQPGGGLFDLRHEPGPRSIARPTALYEAKGCRAQRGARGVPAARPPRIEGTKKAPVGAFRRMERLSLGWAYSSPAGCSRCG